MPRRNRTEMELALENPGRLRAVPEPGTAGPVSPDASDADLLTRVAGLFDERTEWIRSDI